MSSGVEIVLAPGGAEHDHDVAADALIVAGQMPFLVIGPRPLRPVRNRFITDGSRASTAFTGGDTGGDTGGVLEICDGFVLVTAPNRRLEDVGCHWRGLVLR